MKKYFYKFLKYFKREDPKLRFFNTLSRSVEHFVPHGNSTVRMYNCGPTVYDRQHIGNLSAAVFADTLRRILQWNGMTVKQVINFTDFGHLSGDNDGNADEGEDRMTRGLKREGLALTMENMYTLATKYIDIYLEDIKALNVGVEKITFPRASEYVPAQIAMIETLVEKGYGYVISDGVYFDTTRFPKYGELGGMGDSASIDGARVAVKSEKHHPQDFALWKSAKKIGLGAIENTVGWDSPWGKGYPGWHIECSAMIHSLLGKQIDIHTGGVEHIGIHHNNEIAQAEAATGKRPFSRFWMHREHIRMNNAKLAKSTGNTAYLSDVVEKGISPLALRYWYLTSHYRKPTNFTWEALEATQTAWKRLRQATVDVMAAPVEQLNSKLRERLANAINDDVGTPMTLALAWDVLADTKVSAAQKKALMREVENLLAIGIFEKEDVVPTEVLTLLDSRALARSQKDFADSDILRSKIAACGYDVLDTPEGQKLRKK